MAEPASQTSLPRGRRLAKNRVRKREEEEEKEKRGDFVRQKDGVQRTEGEANIL